MSFFETDAGVGRLTVSSNSSIGTLAGATGVTISHKQIGTLVKSVITLAATPQSVVNGTEFQNTKLWTFPKGEIRVESAAASLAQTTTSALATTLNASSTGAVGVGSTVATSTTLATTVQNIIPTTAFVSSATISVAGTAVAPILGTGVYSDAFLLDGNTTAIPVYLNSAFADTTNVDGDATMTWAGTITIVWSYLGGIQSIL